MAFLHILEQLKVGSSRGATDDRFRNDLGGSGKE